MVDSLGILCVYVCHGGHEENCGCVNLGHPLLITIKLATRIK